MTTDLSVQRDYHPTTKLAKQHTLEVIATLKEQNLISPKEIQDLINAQAFMVSTYTDVESYRPLLVKLTGVLTDARFPTADSKFWQCKIEAEVHINELTNSLFKLERSRIDLEEMDYKIDALKTEISIDVTPLASSKDMNLLGFDLRRLVVAREQYEFNIKLVEKDIKYRMKEITDWSKIAGQLAEKCQYSKTDYQEHYTESHTKYLQFMVNDAKTPEAQRTEFKDQLATLINIMRK